MVKKIKNFEDNLSVADFPDVLPDFRVKLQTKDVLIATWLKSWIKNGIRSNKLQKGQKLPLKKDIATHLGVSLGTVQSAIRLVEDEGLLQSKQRIGTMIAGDSPIKKQKSRRDMAIDSIKKIILDGYKIGDFLGKTEDISSKIDSSLNITKQALEHLCYIGILDGFSYRSNKAEWKVRKLPESSLSSDVQVKTLVNKIEKELASYIFDNFKINDKLPSNKELAKCLGVSVKTIHDAMQPLIENGCLVPRRGNYGTIIAKTLDNQEPRIEDSIFATSYEAQVYFYEKIKKQLYSCIFENYSIDEKLPTIDEFSTMFNVSSNTIRKALEGLEEQSIIEFRRGRYGGTFLRKLPEDNLFADKVFNENKKAIFEWLTLMAQNASLISSSNNIEADVSVI